ncbi:MAG: Ig-like domain-containing protein [Candidatus Gottesmanbacteria bacterium]
MKTAILISLLTLIILAIPVSVIVVKKSQETRSSAAPATTLSLKPASNTNTINVNNTFTVDVHVNTGGNQIVSVDLVLIYSPNILEATDISVGTFLSETTQLQKNIDNNTGKIIYSFFIIDRTKAKSGQGTLATVTFKGKSTGTSTVTFDSTTTIGGLDEGSNVINSTIPGSYIIGGDNNSNPSPTPTSSPRVTPSSSPRVTPTPSISPSPTSSIINSTTITAPKAGQTVTKDMPTISGTTVPKATITISINSPTVAATVTADNSGNWSYTPTTSLGNGSHTVVITAKDPTTGQTTTKTSSFIIAAANNSVATMASQIVTGNSWPTVFLAIFGLMLLVIGLAPKIL